MRVDELSVCRAVELPLGGFLQALLAVGQDCGAGQERHTVFAAIDLRDGAEMAGGCDPTERVVSHV